MHFKILFTLLFFISISSAGANVSYGVAMHGDLKYKAEDPFDYVHKDAPTGGKIRLAVIGTFDSYNGFVIKGTAPAGLDLIAGDLVFERLMIRSHDEPFSLYCHLAETIFVAPDRSYVEFTVNPKAKWADGYPVTAKDVAYSFQILKEKGRPNHRLFYAKVKEMNLVGENGIRFSFSKIPGEEVYDPELPLLIGLMPVLPSHLWETKNFEKLRLEDMVGSGPYQIKETQIGRSIRYSRRHDYWGWGMPRMQGQYNFQDVRFDYYRNPDAAKEAFKAGECDFMEETDPGKWAVDYDFKATKNGEVIRLSLGHKKPVGMKALVFNTRRDLFADRSVREALSYAMDFERDNRVLYHGAFTRTTSFFHNTELASVNEDTHEKDGDLRQRLIKASNLLKAAGWVVRDGVMVNKKTGHPLRFEILLSSSVEEKIALAYARNLKRLGVKVSVRIADSAQYEKRRLNYDYDMIVAYWYNTLSPGREQMFYWGSSFSDVPGSRNYPGIKDPVVDSLCEKIATARSRESLIFAAKDLDRALLWGHYVIPLYHNAKINLAYWRHLGHPEWRPDVGVVLTSWWSKNAEKE